MLGIDNVVAEYEQPLALSSGTYRPIVDGLSLEKAIYVGSPETQPHSTVLIFGDSFTEELFAPMIIANGRRVVWKHHNGCTFDWGLLEKFRPDEVWYMPTERALACWIGSQPIGTPPESPSSVQSAAARHVCELRCSRALTAAALNAQAASGLID
jgi:hypothetical protein